MDNHPNFADAFLSTIAEEIKQSFESPVILLTMKDYAECVFESLMEVHQALTQGWGLPRAVKTFHEGWLNAVQEVETMQKLGNIIPRETVSKALKYTKKCAKTRQEYFDKYMELLQPTLTDDERKAIIADVHSLLQSLYYVVEEKRSCLSLLADHTEYYVKISYEFEELMNWLDSMYNHLAITVSKFNYLNNWIPHSLFLTDLTKTLFDIIEEVSTKAEIEQCSQLSTEFHRICGVICGDKHVSGSPRQNNYITELNNPNLLKANDEDPKTKSSQSIFVISKHRTKYFQEKLESREHLRLSLASLRYRDSYCDDQLPLTKYLIFEHLLPAPDRLRLVEKLLKVWNFIGPTESKSIVSILSVVNLKESYSDDIGHIMVDKHGQKLYKMKSEQGVYELDEDKNIRINDVGQHVYSYASFGAPQCVAKTRDCTSENVFNRNGFTLKYNYLGTEYCLDDLDFHYQVGQVRKRHKDIDNPINYSCIDVDNFTRSKKEDRRYTSLPIEPADKDTEINVRMKLGFVLKKCIAEVVLNQPKDVMYVLDLKP